MVSTNLNLYFIDGLIFFIQTKIRICSMFISFVDFVIVGGATTTLLGRIMDKWEILLYFYSDEARCKIKDNNNR